MTKVLYNETFKAIKTQQQDTTTGHKWFDLKTASEAPTQTFGQSEKLFCLSVVKYWITKDHKKKKIGRSRRTHVLMFVFGDKR